MFDRKHLQLREGPEQKWWALSKNKRFEKTFIYIIITLSLVSCSVKKSFIIDYNSERLCNGIKNLTKYIENSNEVKIYFSENNIVTTELKYEVDTLVTEGFPFIFSQSEVANYVKNEEKSH